ncbi:MAG: ornithine carbamoyltransferase [Alphaproteobacteria bacterium]|jgi:ornithine carbamoyltransferase|nr:ornithine carbamoyltransferase [Alphaproteobacteria bacterium]PPR57048.1 MAG: Ornithine carbamoyltransferase [Alphaproteobacteria bacterium MarineAlpha5_Bin3]
MIKHFIDLDSFRKKELRQILSFAQIIKKNPLKYSSLLKSKSLGLLFEKQSTRTRLSFSIGMQKIGGHVIELNKNDVGFESRETTKDLLKTMSQYFDLLIIRNDDHNKLLELASLNILPIINGLSNYSHPCQILSDIFTIEETLGKIENQTIAWVGDLNNVLISLLQAAEIFNFKLKIAVPESILISNHKMIKKMNLRYSKFFTQISKAVKDTNCVMTDVWVSMGEKNSKSKKIILQDFQVNDQVMQYAKKNAIFMHCLPAHRNEEVTDSVIDGKQSKVWQQAQNRMYVQQSILNFLLKS